LTAFPLTSQQETHISTEITNALKILLHYISLSTDPCPQKAASDSESLELSRLQIQDPVDAEDLPVQLARDRRPTKRPPSVPPSPCSTLAVCKNGLKILKLLAECGQETGWGIEDKDAIEDVICDIRKKFLEAIVVAWREGKQF
jgi:hypothetical protein